MTLILKHHQSIMNVYDHTKDEVLRPSNSKIKSLYRLTQTDIQTQLQKLPSTYTTVIIKEPNVVRDAKIKAFKT